MIKRHSVDVRYFKGIDSKQVLYDVDLGLISCNVKLHDGVL